MAELVLSLFPGIGLLDMAFEEEGFCIVRGPDLLWGGDVRRFHPPAGKFAGVIGGPPCKGESRLAHLNGFASSLAAEFCRVVHDCDPPWWVMEAVKEHPDLMHRKPCLDSQALDRERGNKADCICERRHGPTQILKLNNRWLGEPQHRKRYFHSNLKLAPHIELAALEHHEWNYAVLAGHGGGVGSVQRRMAKYSLPDACRLQGLREDFAAELPFTRQWKYEVIGNGVPVPMGRAIARAVKAALRLPDAVAESAARTEVGEKKTGGPA